VYGPCAAPASAVWSQPPPWTPGTKRSAANSAQQLRQQPSSSSPRNHVQMVHQGLWTEVICVSHYSRMIGMEHQLGPLVPLKLVNPIDRALSPQGHRARATSKEGRLMGQGRGHRRGSQGRPSAVMLGRGAGWCRGMRSKAWRGYQAPSNNSHSSSPVALVAVNRSLSSRIRKEAVGKRARSKDGGARVGKL
jgi:hypothetical protein